MVPTPVPYVVTVATRHAAARAPELGETLYIHTTPYLADGWKTALDICNLMNSFPYLVQDIQLGSPIGNPPPLTSTFLPRNLPSATLYPDIIDKEILEETSAGRMSGPFTVEEATKIFGGHFCTSPVGLIEKYPGNGKWHMIRHLSKRDEHSHSTNDWIDSVDFPTTYYSATTVASYVSPSLPSFLPVIACAV